MGKAKNPTTFTKHFGISSRAVKNVGAMNPTLAIDTPLFIDPLLLETSSHSEMRAAAASFHGYFEQIIKLLSKSSKQGDTAWRNARRLFDFHEIPGTCIGYGAGSVRGRAFGERLTTRLMETASEIVSLGVDDPDLFLALALFEENVGPDRISDLTANVILKHLVEFNARVHASITVPLESFTIRKLSTTLPVNPFEKLRTPVILLPNDVLRELPIAVAWDDVAQAAAENEALRDRVNEKIGAIWEAKSRKDKEALKQNALASKQAFVALLEVMHSVSKVAYDVDVDPEGILSWAEAATKAAESHPIAITKPAQTLDGLHQVVREIVKQFRHLVEDVGLSKNLWHDGKRLIERHSQLLFFAVAYSYCKANDLDISPEVDSGTGEIDFKFSVGFTKRVVVEVKLSTNNHVIPGYTKQLESYKKSQETARGVYIVIDVGSMGKKDERLVAIRNEAARRGDPLSDLEFVDGKLKPSASKLK